MGFFSKEFSIRPIRKMDEKKESIEYSAELENVLKSLENLLSQYGSAISEYDKRLKDAEPTKEDQMAAVQVALDLTYIKEELDGLRKYQDQNFGGKFKKLEEQQEDITRKTARAERAIVDLVRNEMKEYRESIEERTEGVNNQIRDSKRRIKTAFFVVLVINVVQLISILALFTYIFILS